MFYLYLLLLLKLEALRNPTILRYGRSPLVSRGLFKGYTQVNLIEKLGNLVEFLSADSTITTNNIKEPVKVLRSFLKISYS